MSDSDIIKLYQQGKTVDFIVDRYYNYRNSSGKGNFYKNGNLVITKEEITKKEARYYIINIIFKYICEKEG